MPFIQRPLDGFWLVLLLAVALGAQRPPVVTPAPGMDVHAQQVVTEARRAIGSTTAVNNLHTLEVDMSVRRILVPPMRGRGRGPAPEQYSHVTLQFLLPNAFRRTQQIQPFTGFPPALTLTQVQNGDQAWFLADGRNHFFEHPMMPGGPSPGAFRRNGAGPGGSGAQGPETRGSQAGIVTRRRFGPPPNLLTHHLQQQAARDLLLLTLWTPQSSSLQWHYFGTAMLPGGKADVVDIAGFNHFAARLFLDQTSHRLVMMSYRNAGPPRFMIHIRRHFRQGHSGPPRRPMDDGPQSMRRMGPGPAGFNWRAAPPPGLLSQAQPVELHFSDFRREHGVLMPHTIVATRRGRPMEEVTIQAVKWNPSLPASDFEKGQK